MIFTKKKLEFSTKWDGFTSIQDIQDDIISFNDIGATHINFESDEEGVFFNVWMIRPETEQEKLKRLNLNNNDSQSIQ